MNNYKLLAILVALMLVAGCASMNKNPGAATAAPESRIQGNIPASNPFSRIQIGMSQKQVHDILGQPTDSGNYTTGKMFIPFYFGNDMMRFEDLYKGMGTITYTGAGIGGVNLHVYSVIYDPTEDGYADKK